MHVVHICAGNAYTADDISLVGLALGMTDGVRKIATVESLALFSVLFDESVTTSEDVLAAVRRAGFDACECRPGALFRHGREARLTVDRLGRDAARISVAA